jgi:hypothetical protein
MIDEAREKQKIEKVARRLMVEQRKAAEWRQIRGEPALPGACVPPTHSAWLLIASAGEEERVAVESRPAVITTVKAQRVCHGRTLGMAPSPC